MTEPTAPAKHVIKRHQLFYVVNAKDETIAHVKTYERHGVRWMTDVWVDPEHRRQGLATRLIREALEAHKSEDVYLNVHGYTNQPLSDAELTAWYAKFGFNPAGAPGVMVRRAIYITHYPTSSHPAGPGEVIHPHSTAPQAGAKE